MATQYCDNCGQEIEQGKRAVQVSYGKLDAKGNVRGAGSDFFCANCAPENVAIRSTYSGRRNPTS